MQPSRPQDMTQIPASYRTARGRLSSGKPNPVDVHVGRRVRLRRIWLGMSQEKLGDALGLTFQQVQKYERGANRIGASRLYDISRVLDCPMTFFFEEMDEGTAAASPRNLGGGSAEVEIPENDSEKGRQALELMRAFYQIPDYGVRARICELAKSLGAPH